MLYACIVVCQGAKRVTRASKTSQAQIEVPRLLVVPGTPEDLETGGLRSSEQQFEKGTPNRIFGSIIL